MYTLNGIDIKTTYGIRAGQRDNSNIALSGCFSMPARTGKCFHDWGDSDSVEPYVEINEMFFAGRDLKFSGFILGTNLVINDYLKSLYDAIKAFSGLIAFATPYGSFLVYVKSVTPEMFNGVTKIVIVFREPVVDLTEWIPSDIDVNSMITEDDLALVMEDGTYIINE